MQTKRHSRTGVIIALGLFALLVGVTGIIKDDSALAGVPAMVPVSRVSTQQQQTSATYRGVIPVAKFDVSPPLSSIAPVVSNLTKIRENEDRENPGKVSSLVASPDTVLQKLLGPFVMPTPIVSFNGPGNLCGGCAPPDPNGEVGPNHVVVMDNLHFQIFNKTGTSLYGPVANNTLWSGFGGACQTENAGDPVVLYDQLANRWLLSQFTGAGPTYYNCIAISTGADPTGTYYRWAFSTGANFPDYPKYGMWPDAYYISTREFLGSGGPFQGVGAYAGNRTQMIAGNPSPQVISFLATPSPAYNVGDGLLPSDLDGTTLPPANSPNYFVGTMDNNGSYGAPQDALTLWKFHADFVTPANSSFILANTIPSAAFNTTFAPCGGSRNCIPQPGTANKIDILSYRQRPLFRLAYRNMGTHESLVTNQSVSAGTGPGGEVAGIRWWELRSPNSSPIIYQQGTYAPGLTDGIHRWMGSIAMDRNGNMGLGYSASSTSVFPSIYYTGRLAADPLGQMPQGEAAIINGTGSQTGAQRWGDYTDMTVDPTDDCTFWYVNEWVPTTSSAGWQLRIGAFKFPSCTVGTPTPSVTGTPPTVTRTPTLTPTPCSGVNYLVTTSTATIVPGTTDTGNHTDDGQTIITLPFSYQLYDQTFITVTVESNGKAYFQTGLAEYANTCLPATGYTYSIFPYWDDLRTDGTGSGIFTSVSGSAPNRIFNIEWRATYYSDGTTANFEIRLYEGQRRFDIVFGTVTLGNISATSGVQKDASFYTQYFCNATGGAASGSVSYTFPVCATATNTPTRTNTNTPIPNTPTRTNTNTPIPNTPTRTNTNTPIPNTPTRTNTNTPVPNTPTRTNTNTPIPNTPTRTNTNTPIPSTATRTGTPASRILVGHVSWQGRAAGTAAYQAPITLTLKSGATEVNYPLQNTDASGFFTVSLGGLSNGTYGWRAKGPNGTANLPANSPPGFLSASGTVDVTNAAVTQLEMGLMRAGDADNNNIISVQDFSILKTAYGKGVGDPGYDTRANFDGNTTISITDFNLIKNNYGFSGTGVLSPGAGSPR